MNANIPFLRITRPFAALSSLFSLSLFLSLSLSLSLCVWFLLKAVLVDFPLGNSDCSATRRCVSGFFCRLGVWQQNESHFDKWHFTPNPTEFSARLSRRTPALCAASVERIFLAGHSVTVHRFFHVRSGVCETPQEPLPMRPLDPSIMLASVAPFPARHGPHSAFITS